MVRIRVLAAGRSPTTVTLVRVMFPSLRTVPLKVMRPPGTAGLVGHIAITEMRGVMRIGQVEVAVLVTATPQTVRPVPVEMLVVEQFVGAG